MSKILCIDASTEACSVALKYSDESIQRYQIAPRQHANLLLPLVDELMAESQLALTQLDAIACHVGPGAFTGIRIGVAIAQGLAYAAELPTIAISSLASLAQQAWREDKAKYCMTAIDARMNEVYFALYRKDEQGVADLIGAEQVISPELIEMDKILSSLEQQQVDRTSIIKIGSGWAAYEDSLNQLSGQFGVHLTERFPSAAAGLEIAQLKWEKGQVLAAHELQPVYLRNNVAEKKSVKN